jgi:hypothetical protein
MSINFALMDICASKINWSASEAFVRGFWIKSNLNSKTLISTF